MAQKGGKPQEDEKQFMVGQVDMDAYKPPELDKAHTYYDMYVEPSPDMVKCEEKVVDVCIPDRPYGELKEKYNYWAGSYDWDMLLDDHYRAMPMCCAEGLERLRKPVPKDGFIADFTAGTGLCGLELNKFGYKNIDAIDGCQAMLVEAKKKGVYRNFYVGHIGKVPIPGLPGNYYDAATICGSLYAGHLEPDSMVEIIRATKIGAPLVFQSGVEGDIVEDQLAHLKKWEDEFKRLCKKGIIERVAYTEEEIKGEMRIYTYRKLKDWED